MSGARWCQSVDIILYTAVVQSCKSRLTSWGQILDEAQIEGTKDETAKIFEHSDLKPCNMV